MGCRAESHSETTNYHYLSSRRILIGNELKFFSRARDDVIVLILAKALHDIFALNERDMRKCFAIMQVIKENVQHDPIENRVHDGSYFKEECYLIFSIHF